MNKTAYRFLGVVLSFCLVVVMATPAFAQSVSKEGSYNNAGFVAKLICNTENYTCNMGSSSAYILKTRSVGNYTIYEEGTTAEGISIAKTTYSTGYRVSAEKTGYVSDGWGVWDVANEHPNQTVRMQSASCEFYVNRVLQFLLSAYA